MDYTREYFIDKFEKVSEYYFRHHCALEQCGINLETYEPTEEAMALVTILGGETPFHFHRVYQINDIDFHSLQWNPKQNILNALRSVNV